MLVFNQDPPNLIVSRKGGDFGQRTRGTSEIDGVKVIVGVQFFSNSNDERIAVGIVAKRELEGDLQEFRLILKSAVPSVFRVEGATVPAIALDGHDYTLGALIDPGRHSLILTAKPKSSAESP
jgi:hypothetical protein